MNPTELSGRFFVALAVILAVCRFVSWALAKVGQPPVVSEMLAGVLLGPSLLGLLSPGAEHALFPPALLPVIYVVGQLGLVLSMFQTGYEFVANRGGRIAGTAGAVSAAGVTAPLVLGALLVLASNRFVPMRAPGVSLGVTAAFVGVTLAVTAFPMLARIITERGLAGTRYGSLSLAAGASDDAGAWMLLAVVLALASGRIGPALLTVGGTVAFAVLAWFGGRPLTRLLIGSDRFGDRDRMLATLALLLLVAWYTETIGLYAVFGAFVLGAILPQGERSAKVTGRVSPLASAAFLPLFFTYSGLHTEFGLLGDPRVLLFAVACVVVAIAAKFGACWGAARWRGESSAVALRVGVLMNARGLMQLIALNVGLEAGIVNPSMFTVLVLVALVTTMMTSPLLAYVERRTEAAPGPRLDPALSRP